MKSIEIAAAHCGLSIVDKVEGLENKQPVIRSAFEIPNNEKMGWINRAGSPPEGSMDSFHSLRLWLRDVLT